MIPLYFCEATGPRIFQYGFGLTQVGLPYQPFLWTWDLTPAEETGVCIFRAITFQMYVTNGYQIGITPIVDDQALPQQTFEKLGSGDVAINVPFSARGKRISMQMLCLSVPGDLQVRNAKAVYVPLRTWPT
jgi:hypothetical protein